MPAYQVYLSDEQKNYLLKYIRDRRCVSVYLMWFSAFLALYCLGNFLFFGHGMTFIEALAEEGESEYFAYFVMFTVGFAEEFIRGFGKTFGHKSDIQCIEKCLYTLDYADFGYREKDTGKHPYYICDNRGETYICPRFLDYRNADTGSKFLYIKLDNGRGYAIADD